MAAMAVTGRKWAQKTVTLPPQGRGCHLVTSKILKEIEQDLSGFKYGLAHLFLQHTGASLTINENYDTEVLADTETFLNKMVPEAQTICQHTSSLQCLVAVLHKFTLSLSYFFDGKKIIVQSPINIAFGPSKDSDYKWKA